MEKFIVVYYVSGKKHKFGEYLTPDEAGTVAKKLVSKMQNQGAQRITKVEIYPSKK